MEKCDKSEHTRKNDCVDEEKPLKKARYLWEVKGKHHLKNTSSGPPFGHSKQSTSKDNEEECESDRNLAAASESSLLTSSKNCCIETFLAKTENIMERDSSDEEESQKLGLESTIESEIPVSLVSEQTRNHDYFLRKWQARQIARGFVDNTINSMLENWVDRPFDAVNFVEDCENDGQVEDDAILMAIQSHGLQSNCRGGINSSTSSLISSSTVNSNSSFNSNFAVAGSSRSGSIIDGTGTRDSSNNLENFESFHKEPENESSMTSTTSSMSVDTTSSMSNPFGGDLGDPMDFLNAAVSVAIQKKGLTYG